MKKYSYGNLVRMSWGRTAQIMFKPFSFKKWIMLSIIILLAGQVGGFNFNITGTKADFEKVVSQITKVVPVPAGIPSPGNLGMPSVRMLPVFSNPKEAMLLVLIVGGVLLLLGLILFLWMWVQANFAFVFIESVVKNDASLRIPFHRNKPQGNSYLMWNIFFSSAAALLLCVIITAPIITIVKSGMFAGKAAFDTAKILSIISPYIIPLMASIIALGLIAMIVVDFILPIMYRKKIGVLSAWSVFRRLLSGNLGEVLLYFLVKLGLAILAILAAVAIIIVGVICFLLIGGISWLLGWLIYLITPEAAKAGMLIILLTLGIGILVILAGLFTLLFLPISVFFRLFSIYVLGSMDESLDIFEPNTPEMAEGEDASRYKKSMLLVWLTVLSPILFVSIVLATAMVAHLAGAKQPAAKQSVTQKAIKPENKLVTVHLKNGNSFKAAIESESKNNISFAIEGGTYILPRSDILRIEK